MPTFWAFFDNFFSLFFPIFGAKNYRLLGDFFDHFF